jgi:HAE1 family hydrophobic/amphiphilic exporter-1
MFLANASTRRPIAMSCLLIALIVLGLNSYRKLSLENMPSVDLPYISVVTIWAGATPEDIEKDITKHIEDAVSGIDGLKHVESSSLENRSLVVLEFNLAVDVDTAAQDVREKLDVVLRKLPADAERPVIQKVNINATPIVNLFLSGEVPVEELYDYADNVIRDRFATLPGVAEVQIIGGNEREIWVELDRNKLAAAGLTTADVSAVLQRGILAVPSGRIKDRGSEFSVRFDAEYAHINEIEELEVVNRDGARRLLKDLGTVRLTTAEVRQHAILDGQTGIVLKIVKKAEGNIVTLVKQSHQRFQQVQRELPGGMELTWVSDESENITESVNSAISSVFGAILLCAAVLLVFLVNIRTTVIVAITMPVTICISLFFMLLSGQTLNTVTLLAIGLSTGVLVSNSIVVLENIVEKFKEIDNPWEAARIGTSEVTVAVLASAGTNVIVMLPIAMMTSLVGRMLTPFAITTLIVNACSILISFTLTPILCAMLLKKGDEQNNSLFFRFGRWWDSRFQWLAISYSNTLRAIAQRRRWGVALLTLFVLGLVGTFYFGGSQLGFNFTETSDFARVFVRVETPTYYTLDKTLERIEQIGARLENFSDLDHVLTTVGKAESMSGQANEGVYMGQIELFFRPKTERNWTIFDRLSEIRAMLSDEPDCLISASVPGMMGGQSFAIDLNLSGDDLDELSATALRIQDATRSLPELEMMETTVRDSKPEIRITPKRAVLSGLGIPPASLAAIVRTNIDGVEAASFKQGTRTYDIRVKLKEEPGKEQIRQFLLPGHSGKPITLETVADVADERSMVQIFRSDKERTIKVLGDIKPGATMSSVLNDINQVIADEHLLPPGYTLEGAGMAEMMDEALADFTEAILLACFLTLLTLAAILESWSRPALVLLTLPMALIGIIWSLVLTNAPITILVLLGVLMLIGVVVNSAILIVDRMGQHLANGVCRSEAMLIAIVDEFRPVLMVIFASGLGMLPIAVSTGIGSENRAGIGVASVGGIITAGILSLIILPLLYNLFNPDRPQRLHQGSLERNCNDEAVEAVKE